MINRSGLSVFMGAVLAAVASIGGCSSSDSPPGTSGAAGDSCTKTADCGGGLACIAEVCVVRGGAASAAADGGLVFAIEGGPGVTSSDASIAVEAAAPPRASAIGESCVRTADCGAGLVCLPSASGAGAACGLASYGLKPSGKTCSGECAKGADCCELPLGTVIGATAVKTCQDILALALVGNTAQCTSAVPDSDVGIACFLYATYCSTCATGNVWSCVASQCVYNLPCQNSGTELGGCPGESRTGRVLGTSCDTMTSMCEVQSPRGICNEGADCDGKGTFDGAGICRGGDCSCYKLECYTSCSSDLDCRQGYSCETTSKVCMKNGCSSDSQCAVQTGIVDAKCVGPSNLPPPSPVLGTCKLPCTSDRQCGASGLGGTSASSGAFGGQVCGSDGFCEDLGCTNDADCQEPDANMNPGSNPVNFFCVAAPPPTPPTPVVASAITN